jgi:hypothetical protein
MPRLSLYKPERGNDYAFLDKSISEMFTIGGTDVFVHKYLGPKDVSSVAATADQPSYVGGSAETSIQDMLFLENRDRKYDPNIYNLRGIYNVQDIDFDLSQFGLFLSNDTLFMTIHISDSVRILGRKAMAGDVIELPHLVDEHALNDYSVALKRFYVIEDVNRASEGFSPTWYPHLYRLKLKQIYDGQEFKEILDLPANEEEPGEGSLRDILSTYEVEMQINDAVVAQAETDAGKSGYDTAHYYSLSTNSDGSVDLETAQTDANGNTAARPARSGYNGYLLGTTDAPNGAEFGMGISFPLESQAGDYFLRTDFLPKRLFRYNGSSWTKMQDGVRVNMSQTDTRNTQKTSFINNTNSSNIAGETINERQSLSKALRPKGLETDN